MDLLIHDGAACDPVGGIALEEALARAAPPCPLLRIWRSRPCVVIGRAQQPEREADLAACAAARVPVTRRATGGGAVYIDPGTLLVSVATPGPDRFLGAWLARLIARAACSLGAPALAGERGVRVGTAKIGGLASQVTRTGSLAHATLLVTTPSSAVTAYLAPVPADHRPTDSRRSPVASLRELCSGVGLADARAAVLAEAEREHGPLTPRSLRDPERRWQERLLAERYRSDSWHLTGRTKETPWTTRPVLTSTG